MLPNSTLNFTIQGQAQPQIKALDSLSHLFDTAGDFTVTVLHAKSHTTQSLTVHVEGADLPSGIALCENNFRVVPLPGVKSHLVLDCDNEFGIAPLQPAAGGGSNVRLEGSFPGTYRTAVRMNPTGPILDIEEVNVAGVSGALRNDSDRTLGVDNGLVEIRSPLLLTHLAQGAYAVVTIFRAGVTFTDGTTVKTFTAADLDEYGVVELAFYFPVDQAGGYCHYIEIFDANGNPILSR